MTGIAYIVIMKTTLSASSILSAHVLCHVDQNMLVHLEDNLEEGDIAGNRDSCGG